MKLTLADVQTALLGAPETDEAETIRGQVVTDSRVVGKGDFFLCIAGDNFDGHEFAEKAVAAGASAVISERPMPELGVPVIVVRDSVAALGKIAAHARGLTQVKVAGVTGSAGKTTVKEMLADACVREVKTARNLKNFNNQIGLPSSMLGSEGDEAVWVMELGISHVHDMDELGPVATPDVGIITNAGAAHLAGLGSVENVARAKAGMLKYLAPEGVAVVNGDDELLLAEAQKIVPEPITFSIHEGKAPFTCTLLLAQPDGRGTYRMATPEGTREFSMSAPADHLASNAAAVAAAAHALGISLDSVIHALERFCMPQMRFTLKQAGGWTIIDDTYNANPLSTACAMHTARRMAGGGTLALVLGDMLELGEAAAKSHREIGALARELGVDAVLFQGQHAEDIREGLGQGEGAPKFIRLASCAETPNMLAGLDIEPGVVLVKGSRSCRMEKHVAELAEKLAHNGGEA